MKKLKLLLAICALMGGVFSASARTDVTSTYLTDAALEDEATNWGYTYSSGNHNWNSNYKYHESWHNTFTLSQTVSLPNGYYQISLQVMNQQCPSSNFTLTATSGQNSATAYARHGSGGKDFAALSASFASDPMACRIFATVKVENGSLTVGASQTSNAEWIVYGQFKLYSLTKAEYDNAMALQTVIEADNSAWTDGWTNQGNLYGYGRERFNETAYEAGKIIYKTLSGLPKGKYDVIVHAKANKAWREVATGDNIAEVYANDATTKITVEDKTAYDQTSGYNYTFNNVLVNDGNLEVGIRNTATGGNWYVASLLHLTLVDPYLSVVADEVFTSGNTMEADQWYKYTVPTDGDYTLSATEGIVYSVEDKLVSEATTAATSTVALPAGTVYFKSTTSQTLTITYVEPVVDNGEYYLYDAATQKFLSRGEMYGTQATLDNYGIPVVWNNYTKTVGFVDWSGVGLFINASNDFYTDGGTPATFAFEETEGGYYLRDAAKTKYVGLKDGDGSYFGNKVFAFTTESSQAVVFTFKTKSEHDAIVAAYPTGNKTAVITAASLTSDTDAAGFETWLADNRAAKDYTSYVGTAKFTGSKGDWTWHETNRTREGQPAYGTDFAEMFSVTGYFDQTISGLPEGLYKVTVNAFEREKGYADCNTLGAAGWEIVTAYFDANGQSVQLKSWYSERTGTSNPNSTTEAATAFNNDKYKNEVYCYVGNDGNLTLKLAKPSYIWDSWVLFNNVTLTYYDSNVSPDDATAILAEATTTMESPMKHSLYAALSTAKETFDDSRTVPDYNALRTAIDNTATSIASYATMKTNYLDKIADVLATTNVYNESADETYTGYKASYYDYKTTGADVENATANALKPKTGTSNRYTSEYHKILTSGWTINGNDASANNSGFYVNTWSGENAGEGDAKDFANPFYEMWVSSGSIPAATLSRTITGLTENAAYSVTAKVRVQGDSKVAGSITMEVVGGVPVDVTAGDKIGETSRYIKSYTATGVTDGSGNLVLKFNIAANSNVSWLAFRDINYAVSEATVSNDFTDLNTAISTAEGKTLGFEAGEYAPYNNAAGLQAIATAKAFDQDRYYISSMITDATTALTGATWTANTADVDAIYNGMFTTSQPGDRPLAWTRSSNWGQLQSEVDGKYATAFYNQPGYISYGDDGVYTMPLAANTTYALTFAYRSHENNSNNSMTVSVLNAEDGLPAMVFAANKSDADWKDVTKNFKTGAAGNYILKLANDGNTWITNVSLVKSESKEDNNETIEISEFGYATYVSDVDLDYSGFEELTAYKAKVEGSTVVLTSVDKVPAGEGVVLKGNQGTYNIPVTTGATALGDNALVRGTGAAVATTTNDGKNYVLSISDDDDEVVGFYLAEDAVVPTYRAYLQTTASSDARLTIVFEDEATGVSDVRSKMSEVRGDIYNLNGQRVSTPKHGLYILNGKKVVIK